MLETTLRKVCTRREDNKKNTINMTQLNRKEIGGGTFGHCACVGRGGGGRHDVE